MKATSILAAFAAFLFACGSGGLDSSDSTWAGRTARLGVALTDSSRHDPHALVSEAHVSIDGVTAHVAGGGGWVTVRENIAVDVDVMRLAEFAAPLGFGDLPAGKITQIRLHVGQGFAPWVRLPDSSTSLLKVPSGEQSGLKVKGMWGVGNCQQLNVDLDFNGPKSIHIHPVGSRDLWILRPVIKAGRSTVDSMDDCDPNGGGGGGGGGGGKNPPGGGGPGGGGPGGGNPGGGDPGDGTPGDNPNPTDPGSGDPGTGDPGTGDPGTGDPGSGDPGSGDPSGGDPGTPVGGDPNGGVPVGGGAGTPCTTDAMCDMATYCSESGICVAL